MNLRNEIQQKVSKLRPSDITLKMGYSSQNSSSKASQRIQNVIQSENLNLDAGEYDFRFTDSEFLIRLCGVIGVDSEKCVKETERITTEITENNFGFQPFIFVDTEFKRKNEPIFALAAMESSRRIRIPKEVGSLPLNEQIPLVKQIIQNHFIDCDGELPLWGEISCYKYYHAKEASIIFDVNGSVIIQGGDIEPPPAKVLVNGKNLF